MDSQPTTLKTFDSSTAIVHYEYSLSDIPPKPAEEKGQWTRFVCISDTHCRTFPVPEGDVLLHSGDLTNTGTLHEMETTIEWIRSLPHPLKIIIAGNHDLPLHQPWYNENYQGWHSVPEDVSLIIDLLKGPGKPVADGPNVSEGGLVYLQDQTYEFQTHENGRKWSVYGSPWQPEFCDWAFNYTRDKQGDEIVSKIPKTDILLTHGPPYDIFDVTTRGEPVGCEALRARLPKLRPRLHLFGHIHEARGANISKWDVLGDLVTLQTSSEYDAEDVVQENPQDAETTVFVNASAWPMGRGRRTTKFGGLGFQPVIVDLLDDPTV